jgi:hypothetical protein
MNGPAQSEGAWYTSITVSSTVVSVGASEQVEKLKNPDCSGASRYQTLRDVAL